MGERSARSCPRCGATYEDASIEFCRHDGARLPAGSGAAASDAVVDSLLGTVVAGEFRIIELLGKGGMGAVYAADHW